MLSPPEATAKGRPIPWSAASFLADEGCQWQRPDWGSDRLRANAHYLAGPRPGEDWRMGLAHRKAYREAVRSRFHDRSQAEILLRFDGVRAWVRTARRWAFAADQAPAIQWCYRIP